MKSSYRKTMAEALEEVSLKNKLKVLDRKIKKLKDKAFKKTMSTIKSPLFADNEIEEGRMKDIYTMDQEGKSAKEIAKLMKLPVKTVKDILGEGINPYVSMQRDSKTGKMNYVVLDKDEKEAYKTTDQRLAQDYLKKNYNKLKEENLDEFTTSQLNTLKKSYAGMMNKTISPEKAIALSKALDKLDLLSLRQLNKEKIPFISTVARNKIYKKTGKFEEVELEEQSLKQKAIEIAKKMAGNMTGAVREIEKLMKGLSKDPVVATTLKRVNENKEIVKDNEKKEAENKDTQIRRLIDQIAVLKQKLENEKNKAVKPEPNPDTGEVPLTVGVAYKHFKDKKEKQEVKEATVVSDISGISIPALKRETAKFNIKVARVSPGGPMGAEYEVTFTGAEKDLIAYAKEHFGFDDKPGTFQQLKKHLNMDYVPEATKNTDFKVKMKTPSGMRTVRVTVPIKDFVVDMAKIEDAARRKVKGDMVNFDFASDIKMEADLTKKQIKMVHKVADDLPKKDFKDRYGKDKGDAVRFGTATNMVKKKLGMKEDRRIYVETIAGLKKKAEKSGMPYGILKKVYDRGMAAWKSGHRPGASQQQWAFARVNSFVTKSSGTWGGADKDLAAKVRGSK